MGQGRDGEISYQLPSLENRLDWKKMLFINLYEKILYLYWHRVGC